MMAILVSVASAHAAGTPSPGVNAVLGDQSYVARFGRAPDATSDETTRLQVHLEYVETRLRAADASRLDAARRAARARNLELLRVYHRRGVFPRNPTVPGRRPHFIDRDGRICAVGLRQGHLTSDAERTGAAELRC